MHLPQSLSDVRVYVVGLLTGRAIESECLRLKKPAIEHIEVLRQVIDAFDAMPHTAPRDVPELERGLWTVISRRNFQNLAGKAAFFAQGRDSGLRSLK